MCLDSLPAGAKSAAVARSIALQGFAAFWHPACVAFNSGALCLKLLPVGAESAAVASSIVMEGFAAFRHPACAAFNSGALCLDSLPVGAKSAAAASSTALEGFAAFRHPACIAWKSGALCLDSLPVGAKFVAAAVLRGGLFWIFGFAGGVLGVDTDMYAEPSVAWCASVVHTYVLRVCFRRVLVLLRACSYVA
jgi:hypothetical protein